MYLYQVMYYSAKFGGQEKVCSPKNVLLATFKYSLA